MLAILIFLNAHNLPIFQPILMILVSKFMVHRALSDKTYLSLGLLSPLKSHPTDWEKPEIEPATPGLQDIGLFPTPQRLLMINM